VVEPFELPFPALIDGHCLPNLHAARVSLRWLGPGDVGALYEVFSNAEVMRYWSKPPFTHIDEAHALLAAIERAFAQRTLFQWGIVRTGDDRVIGTCTLAAVDASNRRAELGYALGRAHWRQGLMREALERLLAFAFGELGLRRLEADVDPRNGASIALLERLGFRREGLLRERWLVAGEVQDSVWLGLLRRDWEARQPSSSSG
jgi:ribosomal-protein-alanine N-acetyltransferase